MSTLQNAKGTVYYGMHFYPGVAEYQEPGKEPLRVFLNEQTLREMDPTFAGCPIFVEHVDDVNGKPLDDQAAEDIRDEADGWVLESFYNSADGKHWVKFIVLSERGNRAIGNGYRLSNAYFPKKYGKAGLWNGVPYNHQVESGEYEHLAIVKNPRYEESVIMTPEEFKVYNEELTVNLKRLANSQDKKGEGKKMALKLFKKEKVENSIDLENMVVMLPKSKREETIAKLLNEVDELEEKKAKNEVEADPSHKVKLHDGSMCNVGELVEKHKALADELEKMKDEMEGGDDIEEEDAPVDSESSTENEEDEGKDEDEEAKKKALQLAEHEEKEIEEAKKQNSIAEKKLASLLAAKAKREGKTVNGGKVQSDEAKEKAKKLRNANARALEAQEMKIELSGDLVARGKARYGSN